MSAPQSAPTPYELIGGEAGIRRLVDRFYDLMDSAPEAKTIRALHASSLKASRDKLYLYLSYWTGGPPPYIEQRGAPPPPAPPLSLPLYNPGRGERVWGVGQA